MSGALEQLLARRAPAWASAARERWLRTRYPRADIRLEGPVHFGPGFHLNLISGEATLTIGAGVVFRRDCVLELEHNAHVEIGAQTTFTYGVLVQCTKQVSIGRGCLFANGASVVDSKHRFDDPGVPLAEQGLAFAPVRVGDGVWVSSKATVAADVGDHSVVAANSAVVRPVPAWTLVGGVQAQELRSFRPAAA